MTAVTLDREHPSGDEYADYPEAVADFHELPVETGIEVMDLQSRNGTLTTEMKDRDASVPTVDGGTMIETELIAHDQDAASVATADVDDETARQLVSDLEELVRCTATDSHGVETTEG